ncbi:MAG: glycosyltransferase family 4 protein, partial [Anaerolineae bacterium]
MLTSSQHAARLLHTQFGVPAGRIHPTPDCVNPDTFNPAVASPAKIRALKQSLKIPPHKQLIVYVGLLTEYQGIDLLLQALTLLKERRQDFHLLLMGFGYLNRYRALARRLELDQVVTFTGKMPYERLPVHLALGDVAVAPKLSATEGNGKILNYMSMALPTVAFNTPVSQEYLGRHGMYARTRAPQALADVLERSLNLSPAAKTQLGRTLRQRV